MARDLREFATRLLEKHGGDIEKTANALDGMVQKDEELRLAIVIDWLARMAPAPAHSRQRRGPHRTPIKRRTTPTKDQKAAAIRAETKLASTLIFDRVMRGGQRLGDIKCSELEVLMHKSIECCIGFNARGYEDGVDAVGYRLLAEHIAEHITVTDPFATVRDVVKPAIASKIFEKAKIEAAIIQREVNAKLARDLIRRSGGEEPKVLSP
jgi:hypothetical protein